MTFFPFVVFELYACSALQSRLQTPWWRADLSSVSRPTHRTTSPAEPPEPNPPLRSPGTEMERSWKLQFIPRCGEKQIHGQSYHSITHSGNAITKPNSGVEINLKPFRIERFLFRVKCFFVGSFFIFAIILP